MAPTLPDMPVEIFHAIIDEIKYDESDWYAREEALLNLRQVCRACEAKTRVRFGRERFHEATIAVTSESLAGANAILNDKIFGDCVREVNVYMGRAKANSHNSADWQILVDEIDLEAFEQQFGQMLLKMRKVSQLSITYAPVATVISASLRIRIEHLWNRLVSITVHHIMAQNEHCITMLEIGRIFSSDDHRPLRLWYGTLNGLNQLEKLDNLILEGLTETNTNPVLSPFNDSASKQTLMGFVTSLPDLEYLQCQGVGFHMSTFSVRRNPDLSLKHLAPLPKLTLISLEHMSIAAVELTEGLLLFTSTLKNLQLARINLTTGNWRAVLRITWQDLNLEDVELWDLRFGQLQVCFREILKERPFILEPHSRSWPEAIPRRIYWLGLEDEEYSAKEQETLDDLKDGWSFICHNRELAGSVSFSAYGGDDLKIWLAMVETRHQLR